MESWNKDYEPRGLKTIERLELDEICWSEKKTDQRLDTKSEKALKTNTMSWFVNLVDRKWRTALKES